MTTWATHPVFLYCSRPCQDQLADCLHIPSSPTLNAHSITQEYPRPACFTFVMLNMILLFKVTILATTHMLTCILTESFSTLFSSMLSTRLVPEETHSTTLIILFINFLCPFNEPNPLTEKVQAAAAYPGSLPWLGYPPPLLYFPSWTPDSCPSTSISAWPSCWIRIPWRGERWFPSDLTGEIRHNEVEDMTSIWKRGSYYSSLIVYWR